MNLPDSKTAKAHARAYLATTAESFNGRIYKGEWGLILRTQAQTSMVDIRGMSFIPLYKVIGSFIFFVSLFLMVWKVS